MRRVAASRSAFLVAAILSLSLPGLAAPAFAGGPITSGQTVAGTLSGPSYAEQWTFTGTAGHRVLIAAVTTSGSVNTTIRLRNPSSVEVLNTTTDRSEFLLAAGGTYTLTIEDSGVNDAGNYSLSLIDVTTGPLTSGPDPDGGATTSALIKTGQFNSASDMDAFTFSGTAGDRITIGGITTGGTANTTLTLYPPNGGAAETYTSSGDRLDWALLATGTYTVVIEDYSDTQTGTYTLSLLNLTAGPLTSGADPDGGTIASAEVKTGQAQSVADFDAYRFTGFAGSRVIVAAVTTTGTMNTNVSIYPPNGPALTTTSADRTELQLPADGTYTIVIEDAGQNDLGTYSLSLLNLSGALTSATDADGGPIEPAQIKTGQFNSAPDFDAYTFSGIAGDHILCAAVATGGTANTTITLYPPSGGAAESYTSSGDQLDWTITTTGTYTMVIEDYSDQQTGTYSVSFMNLTNGPITSGTDSDGGTIVSAEVKTGQANAVSDFDVYRFSANAGNRVLVESLVSAGSMNTNTMIYPPSGPPIVNTSSDRNEFQVPATGTYTIVINDLGLNDTGTYKLTMLNLAGPLTSASDTDGGALVSAQPRTGQTQTGPDFDAYTFTGTAGDHVLFGAVTTSGTLNTTMTLYPPDGGVAETYSSSGDRMDWTLVSSGTYVLVVEDYTDVQIGGYTVSMLNLTAGPFTNGTDLDGGAIASGQVKAGQSNGVGDFDAYQFNVTAGDRVLVCALTTLGAMNTNTSVYPPTGAAVVSTTADRNEFQATQTGTYTVVIEDSGLNDTGSYALSLIDLNGPLTTASDTDGGLLGSSEVRNGQFNAGGHDFDAFTFSGLAGERVLVGALTTGGLANTTITAYPPSGGAAEAYTSSGDRLDWTLLNNGRYTVVVEPYTPGDVGTYTVSLLDVQGGALTSPSDANGGPIAPGQTKNGTISTTPDFDGWQFSGAVGDTVHITATATSGTLNTNIYLYPPYGPAVVNTSNDTPVFVLTSPGIHTIVIEDVSLNDMGNYTLLLQKTGGVVGVEGPAIEAALRLMPPRPNPFSSQANVLFSLPRELPVRVRVYDVGGALVRTLANETMSGGVHSVRWDGRDASGAAAASGLYFVEVSAGDREIRQRLVRMR